MPYLQIDKKLIVPPADSGYIDCPAEVVSDDLVCNEGAIFTTKSTNRYIKIENLYNNNCKLIAAHPNSNSYFKGLDVFKGHLKLNSITQPYLPKGYAPLRSFVFDFNDLMTDGGWDRWIIHKKSTGEIVLETYSNHVEEIKELRELTSRERDVNVLTFFAVGAGGYGGNSTSGFGYHGGGGGGGAGLGIITLAFTRGKDIRLAVWVGRKNSGGGSAGQDTSIWEYTRGITLLDCYGGKNGSSNSGGSGSGATAASNSNTLNNLGIYIVDKFTKSGASGGGPNGGSNWSQIGAWSSYNVSILESKSFGTSIARDGTSSSSWGWPGAGGGSPDSRCVNAGSEGAYPGGGGSGQWGQFAGAGGGPYSGARGCISVWY